MSVDALTQTPATIEAGATIRFPAAGPFLSDDWTLQFALNNGVDAPLVVTADEDGHGFEIVLTTSQTGALKPGRYFWGEIYTAKAGGEKTTGKTGSLTVLPGLATTATPTAAQAMVTRLRGALDALAKSPNQSVNFSGQSYSRASIADYQRQLTYWEARVIRENTDIAALRGNKRGGEIGIEFVR